MSDDKLPPCLLNDALGDAWETTVVDVVRGPAGRCAITQQVSVAFPDNVRFLVGARWFTTVDDARSYARKIAGTGRVRPPGFPNAADWSADVSST